MRFQSVRTLLPAAMLACLIGPGPGALAAPPTTVKMTVTAPKSPAAGEPFALKVDVTIEPPYHIQANPPKDGYIGTVFSIGPLKGIQVGKINYPKGTPILFAGETLPVYKDTITLKVPITAARAGKYVLPLSLRFQACNETQCYPPEIAGATVTLTVGAKGRH